MPVLEWSNRFEEEKLGITTPFLCRFYIYRVYGDQAQLVKQMWSSVYEICSDLMYKQPSDNLIRAAKQYSSLT